MKISVGNDHAGYHMRSMVIDLLRNMGHDVIECGSFDPDPVDFPDIAQTVCASINDGLADRGIMICGTGVGAAIAANKIRGIRAALCHDVHSAHQCVEHDDVNVLCIGAQIIGSWLAKDIIRAFLDAKFRDEPEFRIRVAKIHALETSTGRESD